MCGEGPLLEFGVQCHAPPIPPTTTTTTTVLTQLTTMAVCTRHPRYAALVAVALLTAIFLLVPHHPPPGALRAPLDTSLPARVARGNAIYDKMLIGREGLVKKFGPTPKAVELCVLRFPMPEAVLTEPLLTWPGSRPTCPPGRRTPSVSLPMHPASAASPAPARAGAGRGCLLTVPGPDPRLIYCADR